MSNVATGKERRAARLYADYSEATIISDRAYNLVMGLTVLYGVVVNIILCSLVGNVYEYVNPLLFLILYFVCAIAGQFIAFRSSNPAVSFLGYNMIVVPLGLVVSTLVEYYGGLNSFVVLQAFYYTALITAIMTIASFVFPQFFEKVGGFLFFGLIGILIASIFSIFFGGFYIISLFAAGLFSLYIGYDFYRSQQFAKTVDNAIDCAIDIYLDIVNLFIRILEILGRRD